MVFAICKVRMTTTIKIFCIAASFTLFTLSTTGLELEDTNDFASEEVICETEGEEIAP